MSEYWDLYNLPDNIKNRLIELQEDVKDEGKEINTPSIVDFCKFSEMIDEEILKEFKLSITPDGDIYANWENGKYKNCMHFKYHDNLFFWMRAK